MLRDIDLWSQARNGAFHARVYTWDGAWVSIGRNQSPSSAILADAPVQTVLRPTGGKAVLHGHDLTVGLAGNLADLGISDSRRIKDIYRRAIAPLIEALNAAGVDAVLAESLSGPEGQSFGQHRKGRMDCFAHVSPNDVVSRHTGQKICGCALSVDDQAFLAQISIPVGNPLVDPYKVFDAPALLPPTTGLDGEHLAASLTKELEKLA